MSNGYSYNTLIRFDIATIIWHSRMSYIVNELGRLQQEYEKLAKMKERIVASWYV